MGPSQKPYPLTQLWGQDGSIGWGRGKNSEGEEAQVPRATNRKRQGSWSHTDPKWKVKKKLAEENQEKTGSQDPGLLQQSRLSH